MKNKENNKIDCCSRCNSSVNNSPMEDGWSNYGHIHLGFSAQAFGALCGMEYTATRAHFEAWNKEHKAMTKNEAQEVIFEWGLGYKYNSKDRYVLCYHCQKELLKIIGKFFKYGE